LDQAEAEDLGDEGLEREVLVEVDAREDGLDLGDARALREDRDGVADEGAGQREEDRARDPESDLQVEAFVGAHEADPGSSEPRVPLKRK